MICTRPDRATVELHKHKSIAAAGLCVEFSTQKGHNSCSFSGQKDEKQRNRNKQTEIEKSFFSLPLTHRRRRRRGEFFGLRDDNKFDFSSQRRSFCVRPTWRTRFKIFARRRRRRWLRRSGKGSRIVATVCHCFGIFYFFLY